MRLFSKKSQKKKFFSKGEKILGKNTTKNRKLGSKIDFDLEEKKICSQTKSCWFLGFDSNFLKC